MHFVLRFEVRSCKAANVAARSPRCRSRVAVARTRRNRRATLSRSHAHTPAHGALHVHTRGHEKATRARRGADSTRQNFRLPAARMLLLRAYARVHRRVGRHGGGRRTLARQPSQLRALRARPCMQSHASGTRPLPDPAADHSPAGAAVARNSADRPARRRRHPPCQPRPRRVGAGHVAGGRVARRVLRRAGAQPSAEHDATRGRKLPRPAGCGPGPHTQCAVSDAVHLPSVPLPTSC